MSYPEATVASCLVTLAIAHSVLGESGLLRPLFAAQWSTPMPRDAVEKVLRFAWHLTSLAWLALAAIVVGGDQLLVAGLLSLASAAAIFVMLRGHLAWPIFLLAGIAGLRADGILDDTWLRAGAALTAAALTAAALVHVYWAAGGSWFVDRALPPSGENDRLTPGPLLTLAVALALAVFAGVVALRAFGSPPRIVDAVLLGGVAVLAIRAIGDRRVAGFTKTVRNTEFADADDRYFTPLVVFLALGAAGSLLL